MENVTITDVGDGYYKIKPDRGFKLLNKENKKSYSSAVTNKINLFVAVPK